MRVDVQETLISLPPPAACPRSVVLDCHHVSTIDYSVISELRDLLRQFKLREVELVFCRLQVRPPDITVPLALKVIVRNLKKCGKLGQMTQLISKAIDHLKCV